MSVTDYVGRTNDLLVFHGGQPVGPVTLEQALATDVATGGEICTGIQKLAQTVVVLLLTEIGSDPYDDTWGTSLMVDARNGALQQEGDVASTFAASIDQILRRLAAPPEAPDDEVLVGLELVSFTIGGGSLRAVLRVTSQAGAERTFIVPINIPISQ